MRWKINPIPRNGFIREKEKFLFLPLALGNEVRWLEYAKIKQVYVITEESSSWEDISFVN